MLGQIAFQYIGWCDRGKSDKILILYLLSSSSPSRMYLRISGRRKGALKCQVMFMHGFEIRRMIKKLYAAGYIRYDDLSKLDPVTKTNVESKLLHWMLSQE